VTGARFYIMGHINGHPLYTADDTRKWVAEDQREKLAFSFVDVLADSVVINAPDGTGSDPTMRVDMVFRILPGPGNYQVAAGRTFPPTSAMKLLRVSSNQSGVVVPGDGSFWGQYMATGVLPFVV